MKTIPTLLTACGLALALLGPASAEDWFMLSPDFRCIPTPASYQEFFMYLEGQNRKCTAEQHGPLYSIRCADDVEYAFFKELTPCTAIAKGMKERLGK